MKYLQILLITTLFLIRQVESTELTLLAQNMQFIVLAGGLPFQQEARAREYGDILVGLGDDIPDIIGLSETFERSPTDILVDKITPTHPYQLRFYPSNPTFPKISDSGLTLLSKYPVEAVDFKEFSDAVGLDAFAAKGILIALIRLPSSFAVVSVTHLQASGAAGVESVQRSQIREVNRLVSKFVALNVPSHALNFTAVLGMGDYNIAAGNNDQYRMMIRNHAHVTEDSHWTQNPGEDGFTCCGENPSTRLDYIFNLRTIFPNGRCSFPSVEVLEYEVDTLVVTEDELLSDHLGVRARVAIADSPEPLDNLQDISESCYFGP